MSTGRGVSPTTKTPAVWRGLENTASSDRSQIERAVQEANAAKDEFVSIASHQLRGPATAVKQFLGMVLEGFEGPLPPSLREKLQRAYECNERQLQILNDLLMVAKLDAGRIQLTKCACSLADMLQDIVIEKQESVKAHSQLIILKAPSPLLIMADAGYLRMAIENLVDNASKYSPDGSPITIMATLYPEAEFAEIKVRDRGIGMRKKDQAKLYQKFSRIENELSAHIPGTGLGLYWAKKVVELHGGQLRLVSRLHRGSTFTIQLPLAKTI